MNSAAPRIYSVDNDILIWLSVHYPRDIFGSVWENIEALIEAGRFLVSEKVANENVDDWTTEWLASHPKAVQPPDDLCLECLTTIVTVFHENFVDHEKLHEDADPFVIALL